MKLGIIVLALLFAACTVNVAPDPVVQLDPCFEIVLFPDATPAPCFSDAGRE